jgi:hypothetical protein
MRIVISMARSTFLCGRTAWRISVIALECSGRHPKRLDYRVSCGDIIGTQRTIRHTENFWWPITKRIAKRWRYWRMNFPRYNTLHICYLRLILLINLSDMPQQSVNWSIVNLKQFSNLLIRITIKRRSVFSSTKKTNLRSVRARKNAVIRKVIKDRGK